MILFIAGALAAVLAGLLFELVNTIWTTAYEVRRAQEIGRFRDWCQSHPEVPEEIPAMPTWQAPKKEESIWQ